MRRIGVRSGSWPCAVVLRLLFVAAGLSFPAACGTPTVDRGVGPGQSAARSDPTLPPVPPRPTGQPESEAMPMGEQGLQRLPIPEDGTVRVGLLLPLSGGSARLGRSMLSAAEMAMFEIADEKFTLAPLDTMGTPDGAAAAAEKAIAEGAQVILGPLLAHSVAAVKPLAQQAGVQAVAFSNSRAVAGDGVFIMGFVPEQQVADIVGFATGRGLSRYSVLAPEDAFGQTVVAATQSAVEQRGATLVRTQYYDPQASDFSDSVKVLADYDKRREALLQQRAMLQRQRDEVSRRALKRLERRDTIGDVDFDAILIPETGQRLRALASLLPYFDVDSPAVRILGLRDWDEIPRPQAEPALIGAWYSAPSPGERDRFAQRFRASFGRPPARLASLAYDATALVAVLAQGENGPDFSFEALTNPNGFLGVDGLFRLNANGVVERSLAILEIARDGVRVIQPARQSFQEFTN